MGRAKLKMELIPNEKSRNSTFTKRKQGLIKKLHEFTTLCDVATCMIIYGPNDAAVPEIWPADDREEVDRVIALYKENREGSGNNGRNNFGVSDFFRDRKRRVEEELEKLRRRNLEAKYPTKVDMSLMSEAQLREFAHALGVKAQILRNRIDLLRRNKRRMLELEAQSNQGLSALDRFQYAPSLFRGENYAVVGPQFMQYPVVGAAAQVSQFYPMAQGNVDFRGFDGGLRGMTMAPPLQHYVQYGMVDGVVPSQQVQFQSLENSGVQDNLQYYHQM